MSQIDRLFPPADADAWRALVLRSLKGEPFERLVRRSADGVAVQPLYLEDAARPLLGVRRPIAEDIARPWDLRARVDAADPAVARRHAIEALEGGAASLCLAIDPAGRDGVAVGSQDDLAAALDGVLLDLAPVALDAGFMGPQAANWLAVLAKGAPNAPLAFHMDPLSAFAETGRSDGALSAHVNAAAQAGARHAGAYPRASLFLASGRFAHEAGGTDAQMLAIMLAGAVDYVRALGDAGLSAPQALDRIVLGLSLDQRYLSGVAVTRAARGLWARITGACRTEAPARIEIRGSRRMLAARDVWTNILRQSAAVFAAGAGGADAVVLDPFTRPLGGDNAVARRQSRNIQLVLMEEAHIARVADPAAGAAFFEDMTEALSREAWGLFQRIEAEGGLARALISGLVQDQVEAAREALIAAPPPILGVSLHPDAEGRPPEIEPRGAHAVAPPDIRQGGADDACRALPPVRLSEGLEA